MITPDNWMIYAGIAAAVIVAALTWIHFEFQYIHHKLRFLEGAVVARRVTDTGSVTVPDFSVTSETAPYDDTVYAPLPPEEGSAEGQGQGQVQEQEQEQEQDVIINDVTGEVLPLQYSEIPNMQVEELRPTPTQADIANYLAPLEETKVIQVQELPQQHLPQAGLQQQTGQQQQKESKRRQKKQAAAAAAAAESIEKALIVEKQEQEQQVQEQSQN
jgi:uncharacterized protein YbaR (Trm112 family)